MKLSRWIYFLSFLVVAANLALLGYLVFATDAVWPTVGTGAATASILVVLVLSIRQPGSARLCQTETHTPVIPSEAPFSIPAPEVVKSMLGDDPLENKPWLNLVEECVELYDELDRLRPSLDASAAEFADHCSCRLLEILERCGVSIHAEDTTFDGHRHQAQGTSESSHNGAPIEATLSPGFAVGRRLLRRARVKLAASILPTQEPLP